MSCAHDWGACVRDRPRCCQRRGHSSAGPGNRGAERPCSRHSHGARGALRFRPADRCVGHAFPRLTSRPAGLLRHSNAGGDRLIAPPPLRNSRRLRRRSERHQQHQFPHQVTLQACHTGCCGGCARCLLPPSRQGQGLVALLRGASGARSPRKKRDGPARPVGCTNTRQSVLLGRTPGAAGCRQASDGQRRPA